MGGGNFIARALILANSRAFQRFAAKTSKAIANATSKGQLSVARRYHLGAPYGLHSYPVIQKSRPFCTRGTDKVNLERIEQNEKITVTFVDKDGEETVIKVPVGMSMLEAAHENDIELEGPYLVIARECSVNLWIPRASSFRDGVHVRVRLHVLLAMLL